jgi:hypothetical protein
MTTRMIAADRCRTNCSGTAAAGKPRHDKVSRAAVTVQAALTGPA